MTGRQLKTDKPYLHLKKEAGNFVQAVDAAISGMLDMARRNKESAAINFIYEQQNNKPVHINADMELPMTDDLGDEYMQAMIKEHGIVVDRDFLYGYHAVTENYDGAPDAGPQLMGFGWCEKSAILDLIEEIEAAAEEK